MKNGPYTLRVAPNDYPGKKYRDRYIYEHHLVWWETCGRVVPAGYEIHHINGDHRDNKVDNLLLVPAAEHRKIHSELRRKPNIEFTCGFCNKKASRPGTNYRYNLKHSKSKKLFCSRSCGTKHQFRSGVFQLVEKSAVNR